MSDKSSGGDKEPSSLPDHPSADVVDTGPDPRELIDELEDLVSDRDDPRAKVILTRVERAITRHSGPLPHPETLKEYDNHFPGLGNRIVGWVDQEQSHRHQLERNSASRSEDRMDRSQWIAGGIAVAGITASAYVAVTGHWIAASVIVTVSVGGPSAATAFSRFLAETVDRRERGE